MKKILLSLLLFASVYSLKAQNALNPKEENKESLVKKTWNDFLGGFSYSGQLAYYGDFYGFSTNDQSGQTRARRPDELIRLVGAGSLNWKSVSIPFQLMWSPNQAAQGSVTPPSILGIAPKFKVGQMDVQTFLGTHIVKQSSFTIGDVQIQGAGFDIYLNKTKIKAAFYGGNSQQLVTASGGTGGVFANQGAFERRVYSGKLGYGHQDSTHIYFNLMKASDFYSDKVAATLAPADNAVASTDFKFLLPKGLSIEGEWAKSGFTQNNRLDNFASQYFIGNLLNINATSRLGDAVKAAAAWNGKIWKMPASLRVVGDYITEGFSTVGFPFLQADQQNLKIEPKISLWQSKINLSGAIGQRINNLSSIKAAASTQNLYNFNLNAQLTDKISLAVMYNNFGLRNAVSNDTLKVQNVAQSFTLTPTYSLPTDNFQHTISLTYNREQFDDFNLVSGQLNNNNAHNAMAMYMLAWKNRPMTFDFSGNRLLNNLSGMNLEIWNFTGGISHQFYKKKLQTSLKINYMRNIQNGNSPAVQVMTILDCKYKLLEKMAFSLAASLNNYQFGSERPGITFRETMVRTSLVYTLK